MSVHVVLRDRLEGTHVHVHVHVVGCSAELGACSLDVHAFRFISFRLTLSPHETRPGCARTGLGWVVSGC